MPPQIKQAKLREEWRRLNDLDQFIDGENVDEDIADWWLPKISQAKLETLEAIIKEVAGMRKDHYAGGNFVNTDARPYNQALSDLLTKLKAQKELIEKEI